MLTTEVATIEARWMLESRDLWLGKHIKAKLKASRSHLDLHANFCMRIDDRDGDGQLQGRQYRWMAPSSTSTRRPLCGRVVVAILGRTPSVGRD